LLAAAVLGLVACDGGDALRTSGPGSTAWKDDGTVTCENDEGCAKGETCAAGVCQMKRCGEPDYRSVPPLGTLGYFKRDREIVVAETLATPSGGVRGFDVQGTSIRLASAPWAERGARVLDLAGGNFDGKRPESVATIESGSTVVSVKGKLGITNIPLTFSPVAVTAGDIDADGTDEVIVLAATGTVSACVTATKKCTTVNAPVPVLATDIAAGDIDGDGFAEAVVLAGTSLTVVNFDSATTGQPRTVTASAPATLVRIAVGDLDADGKEDLVGLEDSYFDEEIHVIGIEDKTATIRATTTVASGARDITVGATGGDKETIAVLGNDNTIEMLSFSGSSISSSG
jgi:hypothetical protein